MSIVITHEEYLRRNKNIHGEDYEYLSTYAGSFVKAKIKCNKCGEVFYQIPNSHWRGRGCPVCRWKKSGIHTKGKTINLTKEFFIEKSNVVHCNKYEYDKVIMVNNRTHVVITCKEHGDWLQRPDNHLSGYGCPKCRMSKGEMKIMKCLDANNVSYIHQHRFADCKYKNTLSFDFYIPSKNTVIEYDGEQHFGTCRGKYTVEQLVETQTRDDIKNKYCQDNTIKIIRISYKDFDKIESVLSHTLQE